jgi:transposase
VETLGVPLLKTKRIPASDVPNCEGWVNAQRNRLKLLFWDGSGLWVCAKRLEKGRFRWPEIGTGQTKIALTQEELILLLGGIDLASTRRRVWYRASAGEARNKGDMSA